LANVNSAFSAIFISLLTLRIYYGK